MLLVLECGDEDVSLLQDEGAFMLGRVFASNASLTKLCLSDCKLHDEGVRALLRKPGSACSLRSLELQRNHIMAHGASAVAAFLAGSPRAHSSQVHPPSRIAHLDLSHNPLGDVGISLLTQGLCEAVALRALILQDCDIGVSGTIVRPTARLRLFWDAIWTAVHSQGTW